MENTFGSLDGQIGILNDYLARSNDLDHMIPDYSREIKDLQRKLQQHARKKEAEIIAAKQTIREDLKVQIGERLRDYIRDSIKTEVATQAKQEVDIQLQHYIPISLTQQAVDSKKRIAEMRIALENSEARIKNGSIRAEDVDEPLAHVLKGDGTRSKLFPANLRSLFSYDDELVKALVKDYELVDINQFMKHMGVRVVNST